MPIQWSSASRTDVGKARKLNEDSVLERADVGLWVVADGMGGHAAGEVASQLIVARLDQIKTAPETLQAYAEKLEDTLTEVNQALVDMAKERGDNATIGSTVVSLIALDDYCLYAWAGDSRAYRLRDNTLERMTQDHSQAEVYVSQGLMTPEEAAVHPAANMVTRAIGASSNLSVDMDMEPLLSGDRYLLCSDGLDKHVRDDEIEIILKDGDPEAAVQALIELTLERGAMDNVTIIVVDFLDAA